MSALSSYKILELSEGVAGEYCGKLLADFGAEVIKIERPGSGSPTRHLGPFGSGNDANERSGLFAYLNTNKRSIVLDLEAETGVETLALLLDKVDVVIDDHSSGWLAGIGLDPESLESVRPGLVLCSITAYGQNPPDERKYAEDLTVFHTSGWGFHTPGAGHEDIPPLKGPGRFFCNYEAGQEAAMYVVASLFDRESDSRGRFIDVSMHEVMVSRADYVVAQFVAGEMDVTDWRGGFDMHGPGGIFPCKDGFIYVFMATPDQWAAYRKMIGDPEWTHDLPPDWLMKGLTPERIALTRRDLCEWLKSRNKVDAAHEAQALGITLVPVNTPSEVVASPQYQHRKYFVDVTHPVLGTVKYPSVPYRMSETPARVVTSAPLLGKDSEEVLSQLSEGIRTGKGRD